MPTVRVRWPTTTSRVIAVEGYMDVIALAEAGFGETVAPLGTALTEDQVQLLWRMAPEPILCFDGDSAGKKAAFRAVETVLPHLKPGFSVQFAFLPDGLDPDDLIRQQGRGAFEAVLSRRCAPLFDVLIEKEELAWRRRPTPEQRACARAAACKQLVGRIGDRRCASHYETEMRQVLWERTRREVRAMPGQRSAGTRRGRRARGATMRSSTGACASGPALPQARGRTPAVPPPPPIEASNELVERASPCRRARPCCCATLLNHPWLIADRPRRSAELDFSRRRARRGCATRCFRVSPSENSLDRATLSLPIDAIKAWPRSLPSLSVRSRIKATSSPNQRQTRPPSRPDGATPSRSTARRSCGGICWR